jgi:hypothetical protein
MLSDAQPRAMLPARRTPAWGEVESSSNQVRMKSANRLKPYIDPSGHGRHKVLGYGKSFS